MKKIIILLLVLATYVGTASAAKIFINVSDPGWWANDYTVTAISFDVGTTKTNMDAVHKYGKRFRVAEIPSGKTSCKIYRHTYQSGGTGEAGYYNEEEISWTGTADIYKSVTGPENQDPQVTDFDTSSLKWNILVFRQNIINWEGNDGTTWYDNDMHNTTKVDGNTFTFELTKAKINASSNKGQGIRFRLKNGDKIIYNDAGELIDDYPQIYPTSPTLDDGNGNTDGEALAIAGNTTTYYHNMTSTDWYWQIDIPSYDYEKIKITAQYENTSGDNYRWKISADAYISKTLPVSEGGTYYGTFSSGANVDFSNVANLTAQKITDANLVSGALTPKTATTLLAGEGVLLSANSAGPFSIPVASSAAADASNLLVAGTGASVAQSGGGYTNYILTKKTVSGTDKPLRFYMVNSAGNTVPAGSAYLHVPTAGGSAHEFLWFNDETGVDVVKTEQRMDGQAFNLAGQRVSQPTKGLYIVNGKKVIIK